MMVDPETIGTVVEVMERPAAVAAANDIGVATGTGTDGRDSSPVGVAFFISLLTLPLGEFAGLFLFFAGITPFFTRFVIVDQTFLPEPYMNRQNGFARFFIFANIFAKFLRAC